MQLVRRLLLLGWKLQCVYGPEKHCTTLLRCALCLTVCFNRTTAKLTVSVMDASVRAGGTDMVITTSCKICCINQRIQSGGGTVLYNLMLLRFPSFFPPVFRTSLAMTLTPRIAGGNGQVLSMREYG